MKRLWALALLAACAKAPEVPAVQGAVPGLLRNPTAPLASQVDVTAARLKGDWVIRQAVGVSFSQLRVSSVATGEMIFFGPNECRGRDGLCDGVPQINEFVSIAPGRWELISTNSSFPAETLWVHWMDFDDRTVAIGSPSGKFVWIMDRGATGGADRITAARDILDWYGYDLNRLESVQ